MPLPRWLARFNRRFTNRFFRLFAGRLPPWVIMRHRGRNSGRTYEVPLAAFRVDAGFVFALTYGSGADWVRNTLAAGECQIVRGGVVHSLSNPRLIPAAEGFRLAKRPVQLVLRLIQCDEFLALDEA